MKLIDIKNNYSFIKKEQDRKDIWLYYVIRKISFFFTWLFLKFNISANQTTYIAVVIGTMGCGLLAFGDYGFRIIGALLISLWIILDCVDGNIARITKTESNYGEFIDALSGYIMNVFLFLSVGISAYLHPDSYFNQFSGQNILVILGIWTSLSVIFPRLIYHKFRNIFSQAANDRIRFKECSKRFFSSLERISHNIVSFSGFLTPLLLLATVFELLSIFIIFYALINTCILIVSVVLIIFNARKSEIKNRCFKDDGNK